MKRMISKRNQHMETMKLRDLKQKRFAFFIFQAVKWTWISLIHFFFNIASLENLLNLSVCVFSKLLAVDSFFSFFWFLIWIDLIVDYLYKVFPLKGFFKGKKREESSVYPYLWLYMFVSICQEKVQLGHFQSFLHKKWGANSLSIKQNW